jgi:hypothetical protein
LKRGRLRVVTRHCRSRIFLLPGVFAEDESGSLHREMSRSELSGWIGVGLTNRIDGCERNSRVSS